MRNDAETQEKMRKWVRSQKKVKRVILETEFGDGRGKRGSGKRGGNGAGGADGDAAAIEEVDLVDSSSDSEEEEGQL